MATSMSPLRSCRTLALLSVLGGFALSPAAARPQGPAPGDAPRIVFVEAPAAVVLIDGPPAWRPMEGTPLERLVNTRQLVLRDAAAGVVLIHVLDGWVGAPTLAGPWSVATGVPSYVKDVAKEVARTGAGDLMLGPEDPKTKKRPTLESGMPPIVVSDRPIEVIQFDGPPSWVPIRKTDLLYVQNTSANVFRDVAVQMVFVEVSGRWYSAVWMGGPWKHVPASELPRSFATIPEGHPKESVKASIPFAQ